MRITIFSLLLLACMVFISPLYAQTNSGLFNYGTLHVENGAVINVKDSFLNNDNAVLSNKGTVSAGGAFVNGAVITGNGKVVLNGNSIQNITGFGVISNLEINNSAGASISCCSHQQSVTGALTLTAGTLTTDYGLILKSTDSGSARVATVTGGAVVGNVYLDRYIPARRAWRLITAPLTNTNTIKEAWQNDYYYQPGIGTFITGPGGDDYLDDAAAYSLPPSSYSMKTYDVASQLLIPVKNTNVSLSASSGSADNKGYFIFVRGDRDPANLTRPNTNVTNLRTIGLLQTGPQTFIASDIAGNFTLVGNPYVSPVNFRLVERNNVVNRFYAWDPFLNAVGGYVLADDFNNTGTYSISPPSSQTSILQSGQAVFMQTAGTGPASVVFNESSKSNATNDAGFRLGNGNNELLRINLYLRDTDTSILADGVLSEYNNSYAAAVNIEDGIKMENINENLAIQRNGHLLALERRPSAKVNDTMFLNLKNTTSRNYRFKFEPSNLSPVVFAYFEDVYMKTSTQLNLTSSSTFDFNIEPNAQSSAPDRFRIVFKASGTLPVNFTTIQAYQQNSGILVGWNLAAENNMKQYEIEKSANGQEFVKVGLTASRHNNNTAASYSWFDPNPVNGNNFYRIKASDKTGGVNYSAVVNVKIENGKSYISAYPNPVKNNTINIQLTNEPKGVYVVELFNSLGQKMLIKTIKHTGGSATQTIQLGTLVSKGVYQLTISHGENKISKQIVVE